MAITDPNWVFDTSEKQKSAVIKEAIKKNDQGIIYWEEFKQYAI